MAEHTGPGRLGSTPGTEHRADDNSIQTNGIVGRAREQATAQLDTQKNKATDGLGRVAQAVRETTQHLREQRHDTVARYAEEAADQIDRFSERLKGKDVGALVSDAQHLARRQPALFVGGAFAIGLLGARFLKSSSRDEFRRDTDDESTRYAGISNLPSTENAYGNRVPAGARTASHDTPSTPSARRGLGVGEVVEGVRRNPIPALVIGAGVAWLLMDRSRKSGDGHAEHAVWSEYPAPRYRTYQESDYSSVTPSEGVSGRATEVASQTGLTAREAAGRTQSGLQRMMHENPLLVGAAATLVGAAIGASLPETESEQ